MMRWIRDWQPPPALQATARAGRPQSVAHRVRGSLATTVLCAAGAGAAWAIAESLLGHQRPVFAATAAVICLAAGTGGRGRQAVDLLAGVFVGVVVGQLVRAVDRGLDLGLGPVQVLLAVLVAVLVVTMIDTRPLALIQAGSSAVFVLALPVPESPFARLLDATVGGALGLLASQVLFSPDPVRLVTTEVRAVLGDLSHALRAGAGAVDARDRDSATVALRRAQQASSRLGDLQAARGTAGSVAARTLRGRRRADHLHRIDERLDEIAVLTAAVLLLVLRLQALPARDARTQAQTTGASAWIDVAEQIDEAADACADGTWPPPGRPPDELRSDLGRRDETALLQVITASSSRLTH